MKKIFTGLFLLSVLSGSAQNLRVIIGSGPDMGTELNNDTLTVVGSQGDYEIIAEHLTVINDNAMSSNVRCMREEVSVTTNVTAALCWTVCSAYFLPGEYPTLQAPGGPQMIPAGDSIYDLFKLHYRPNNNPGTSLYKVTFYDASVAADTAVFWVRFAITVGTDEWTKHPVISAYPNPANSNVNIEVGDFDNRTYIRITDLLGSTVKTVQVNSNSMKVSTADFKEGIYFYSLVNNNKALITRRLVIAR